MKPTAEPILLANPDGEPPILALFTSHLQACADLCDELEQIADCLPEHTKLAKCQKLAREIYSIVKRSHDFEERALHPLLLKSGPAHFGAAKPVQLRTIQRLLSEHWEDECYAFELQDALNEYVLKPDEANTEALGYMLRGFFENIRRHIAFEMEHIIPAIRNIILSRQTSTGIAY